MSVVPFRDGHITFERAPSPDLIEMCEDLLERAKAGEIIGLQGAILYYDGVAAERGAGKSGNSLIGSLFCRLSALTRDQ